MTNRGNEHGGQRCNQCLFDLCMDANIRTEQLKWDYVLRYMSISMRIVRWPLQLHCTQNVIYSFHENTMRTFCSLRCANTKVARYLEPNQNVNQSINCRRPTRLDSVPFELIEIESNRSRNSWNWVNLLRVFAPSSVRVSSNKNNFSKCARYWAKTYIVRARVLRVLSNSNVT